jgi:hypothetical protein
MPSLDAIARETSASGRHLPRNSDKRTGMKWMENKNRSLEMMGKTCTHTKLLGKKRTE